MSAVRTWTRGNASASQHVGNVTGVNRSPIPRTIAFSPPTKNATSAPSVCAISSKRARGSSSFHNRFSASSTLAASLRSLLTAPGRAAPLAFGVFNGFLPCPLVYAFVAQAASTAGALPGFLTMVSFGLGTFPAMLMMGAVGQVLAPAWRQRGVWLAGSCILLLGLFTLGRGILPFAAHMAHGWPGGYPA